MVDRGKSPQLGNGIFVVALNDLIDHLVVGHGSSGTEQLTAGLSTIGIDDGNIIQNGTKSLSRHFCKNLAEIFELIQ